MQIYGGGGKERRKLNKCTGKEIFSHINNVNMSQIGQDVQMYLTHIYLNNPTLLY